MRSYQTFIVGSILAACAVARDPSPNEANDPELDSGAPPDGAAPDGSIEAADDSSSGGDLGTPCNGNSDCALGPCLPTGVCSAPCAGAAECPPGPEWTCEDVAGHGAVCNCDPSGEEACDGHDNDCDALIDDEATCSAPGYVCQASQCVCPPAAWCDGACADLANDPDDCGACGNVCPAVANGSPACVGGACTSECAAGFGDCDGDLANGCETSLSGSPAHCGACGHSCLGADCNDGTCAGIVLHDGPFGPYGIALDATHVYWTNYLTGSVMKIEKNGGGASELAKPIWAPRFVAVHGGTLYFTGESALGMPGVVASLPIAGGAAQPVSTNEGLPGRIDATDWGLAWVDEIGSVKGMSYGGAPVVLASVQEQPFGVAADSTHVFWSERTAGRVHGVQWASQQQVLEETGFMLPGDIAVDAVNVYVADDTFLNGAKLITRLPRAGGGATTLAQAAPTVTAIATDGLHVYWAETGAASIFRVPVTGGPVVRVYEAPSGKGALQDLALDEAYVYATDQAGQIVKAAK